MKFNTQESNVERFGDFVETNFQIKTTSKAFDILSSGIYTDPILAIIRELSCNAYDSHVAAGKHDEPFTVHLPNENEPWFSIIDNGIGLSDNDIRGTSSIKTINGKEIEVKQGGLYTTYFDSNKSDSNDFIGALGLGSKTPFSYTTSFDVISRHQGKKCVYSVFLNENLIPTVALLSSINTDEESGFEVRVPVKSKDFNTFNRKLNIALRWFPVKPKVLGAISYNFNKIPSEFFSNKKYFFLKNNNKNVSVIQGNVEYKVSTSQILENEQFSYFEKLILTQSNLCLNFNIGEIDVATSREEIRYTKNTINNIVNTIKQIKQDMFVKLEKMENDEKTYWEFSRKLLSFLRNTFIRTSWLDNNELNTYYKIFDEYTGSSTFINQIKTTKCFINVPKSVDVYSYSINSSKSCGYDKTLVTNINTWLLHSRKISFIVADSITRSLSKIRKFLKDNDILRHTVIVLYNKNKVPIKDKNERLNVIKSLGNPQYCLLSTLSHDDNNIVSKQIPIYRFSASCYSVSNKFVKTNIQTVNSLSLYYYVKNRTNIHATANDDNVIIKANGYNGKKNILSILNFLNISSTTKYKMENVFGVGTSGKKILENSTTQHNIFDLLKNKVLSNIEIFNVLNKLKKTTFYKLELIHNTFIKLELEQQKTILKMVNNLPNTSRFKKTYTKILLNIHNQQKYNNKLLEQIYRISVKCNWITDNSNDDIEPYFNDEVYFRIIKQYPMIQFLSDDSYTSNNEREYNKLLTTLTYIKDVDFLTKMCKIKNKKE